MSELALIQKADPIARKKAMVILVLGTVIGTVAIGTFTYHEKEIYNWLENNIDWLAANLGIVFFFGLVLLAPLLVLSGYLIFYGQRVAKSKRIPPPNYAVVRDTRIYIGNQAVLRGRIVQLLSVFLLLASVAIPIFFWYLFDHFSRSG